MVIRRCNDFIRILAMFPAILVILSIRLDCILGYPVTIQEDPVAHEQYYDNSTFQPQAEDIIILQIPSGTGSNNINTCEGMRNSNCGSSQFGGEGGNSSRSSGKMPILENDFGVPELPRNIDHSGRTTSDIHEGVDSISYIETLPLNDQMLISRLEHSESSQGETSLATAPIMQLIFNETRQIVSIVRVSSSSMMKAKHAVNNEKIFEELMTANGVPLNNDHTGYVHGGHSTSDEDLADTRSTTVVPIDQEASSSTKLYFQNMLSDQVTSQDDYVYDEIHPVLAKLPKRSNEASEWTFGHSNHGKKVGDSESIDSRQETESSIYEESEADRVETETVPGQPEVMHGTPEIAHGTPEIAHGTPEIAHGTPEIAHGTPEIAHGTPEIAHGTPEIAHETPEAVYEELEQIHGESEEGHGEEEQAYGEPERQYSHVDEGTRDMVQESENINDQINRIVSKPENAMDDAKVSGDKTDSSSESLLTSGDSRSSNKENKSSYIVDSGNYRKYRVEERTPDGFIVGEYGVVSRQDGSLRGVRYTADSNINPNLIYDTLVKFLSLK